LFFCVSPELVKFDTQLMQNSNISGVQYQQGTLAGYELREYLLEVRPVRHKPDIGGLAA
jgi:hypothetical protein